MSDKIGHEIVRHLAVLGEPKSAWSKELNLVSWNNRDAKFDVRDWAPGHEKCSKGITLTHQEAKDLYAALGRYFGGEAR